MAGVELPHESQEYYLNEKKVCYNCNKKFTPVEVFKEKNFCNTACEFYYKRKIAG